VPIHVEMGWTRGQISGAFSLGLVISGLLGLAVGRLVDRYGARLLMTAGSLLGGVTLFGLAGVRELWQFYLLWSGCLALAMALTFYSVSFVVVANWFQRRRGGALAALTVLGGLSSPIYVPLAGYLVAHLGWRPALVVLGWSALLIALPIHALLIRRRPEDLGLSPDGEPGGGQPSAPMNGVPMRAALRQGPFWSLLAATALSSLGYSVILAHVVAYLVGGGYDPVLAAGVLGLAGLASLPGRFVFNVISDRFGAQLLLGLCLALQGLSVLLLMAAGPLAFLVAFIVAYGIAFGAISPLRASVLADHFGRIEYGSITAVQGVPIGIFAGAGPFLAGVLYDSFGNYRLAFGLTAAAFLGAALAIFLTPRAAAIIRR